MKRLERRFTILFAIGVVMKCGACTETPEAKSRFLSSFQARDVIEKSYVSPAGAADIKISGGETSVLLGERRTYHRDDRAELSISQSDAPMFLQRIKEQIEQRLQSSGCKITDAGSGEDSHSIGYTDGKIHGWIDIWGLGVGGRYKLVIGVTEN